MADDADLANEHYESFLQFKLSKTVVTQVPYSGTCLHCFDPVLERRFCDSDCREQYELRKRRSR